MWWNVLRRRKGRGRVQSLRIGGGAWLQDGTNDDTQSQKNTQAKARRHMTWRFCLFLGRRLEEASVVAGVCFNIVVLAAGVKSWKV